MRTSVLGSGSWGTALALLLAKKGLPVTLYGLDPGTARHINRFHTNPRYLKGVALPASIAATTDLGDAANNDLILFVIPSEATREVAARLADRGVSPDAILLSCSKGIERDSGLRMSQIIGEYFPRNCLAALSGPNHAEEIARELPSATVIGSQDATVAESLQKEVFTLPWFRSYTSDDIVGMELGGTVKNVFAIAAGILGGLGLGDNAKAALVTRGLAEMMRIGTALGGKPETFQGLSGVGDLVVTCYSEHSRNNRVGTLLGQGKSLAEIRKSLGMVAEGVPNTASVYQCARKAGVSTPITDQVYAILYQDKPPAQALQELLTRDPRPEADG